MKKSSGTLETLSARRLRVGIVVSRFNLSLTQKLLDGAVKTLKSKGAQEVRVFWVPGAFEIPFMLQKLAKIKKPKKFSALIALGAVVRGETPHFDSICKGVTEGTMRVSLDASIPIAFGVLTTETMKQALERIGGKHGHKGSEAARVAIEMARLSQDNPG